MDDVGQPIAHQLLAADDALSALETRHSISRLLFRAELPPLGYRVYRFAPDLPRTGVDSRVRAIPGTLENERLRLSLDEETGAIVSCVDRASVL